MELKIEFSIEFEVKRVVNTLPRLDWYNSHGYKPGLPVGITKESSDEEIKNQITKEFEEKNKSTSKNLNR